MLARLLLVGLLSLSASGCWTSVEMSEEAGREVVVEREIEGEPRPDVGGDAGEPGSQEPPAFSISADGAEIDARPFTYCWSDGEVGVCADGFPQPDRVVLRAQSELTVVIGGLVGQLEARWSTEVDGDAQAGLPVTSPEDGVYVVDIADADAPEFILFLTFQHERGDSHTALTIRVDRGAAPSETEAG